MASLLDFGRLSLHGLRARQKRTWLTMIGIFIGIAAVVSLISLGQGMQTAINAQFASVGGDKVIIQAKGTGFGPPGSTSAGKVTADDIRVVERVPGVAQVAARLLKTANVKFNNKLRNKYITTVPNGPEADLIIEANNYKVGEGRMIKPADSGKVLIGQGIAAEETFGKAVQVGNTILINNKPFEVIGLLGKLGDPGRNNAILMNQEDAWDLLGISDEEVSIIVARVTAGQDPPKVADAILKAFRRDRGEKEGRETVQVETSAQVISSFNTILNIVQAVLIGIAMISLLVGGIGIMNTMYTSVLERTREIGVMKAIGARNSDIMTLFLIEAGLLGLVGGVIGILLGIGFSTAVEIIGAQIFGPSLLQAYFPPILIAGAMAFSFIVGTLSGILPARQASRLKPVDALRYE